MAQLTSSSKSGNSAPSQQRSAGKINRITLFAILAVILAAAGSMYVYRQAQENEINLVKQKIGDAINRNNEMTEAILKVASNPSNLSFGEIFQLCNRSADERTAIIAGLRDYIPKVDYPFRNQVIDFLVIGNEFSEAARDFYRSSMDLSLARESYVEQLNSAPRSRSAAAAYRERLVALKTNAFDAAAEAEESADKFLGVYSRAEQQELVIAQRASSEGLRFDPILQNSASSNEQVAQATKQNAEQ